jgi:hypothetical protein
MLYSMPKVHPLNAGSNPFGWGLPSFPRCALFLGLSVGLWVESCGYSMYSIFSHQCFNSSVTKTRALITYHCSWNSKPTKNVRFEKSYNNLRIISTGSFILFFFALFKSLGNIPITMKFTISANQGSLPCRCNNYSSGNVSTMGNGSSSYTILLKWSIIKLSAPLQSLISKSNSCNKRIQRISLGLDSFFASKYFRAEDQKKQSL